MSEPAANSRFLLAVGIATSGRAAILAETLADLDRQTRAPDRVLVFYGKREDVGDLPEHMPQHTWVQSTGGLCEKRNRIMDAVPEAALLFFMDDDFFLDSEYLRITEEAFLQDGQLAAATGVVVADGAKGPGLSISEARAALAAAEGRAVGGPVAAFNAYGCNMTFRLSTVRKHALRFDEQLPAYGWYEDMDFSRRLLAHGSVMRLPAAFGVHLGAKVGRVSGRRLGYSQVANPIYLARKGSYPWSHALRSVGRNFANNLLLSLKPEPWVDRRGRLRGNLLAFGELLLGQAHPSRILHMR